MRGKVFIDGKEVEMVANAATPYRFKQAFHEDYFLISRKFADEKDAAVSDAVASDLFIKLGYVMAMQAAGKEKMLSYDGFMAWLGEYEPNALLEAVNEIAMLYKGQEKTDAVPKSQGD